MTTFDSDLEFPLELTAQPLALIGLAGLDTLNNPVHKDIRDALLQSQAERSSVQFKLFSVSHEFPRRKSKKTQYERFIPKGILKRNWLQKHLTQVPAVVAVFYDLDWDDPQWEDKKLECVARVRSVRAALDGRNTRICLVLIQKNSLINTTDDFSNFHAGKASGLCQAAELLDNKSLFFISPTERLLGYASNLERELHTLAVSYYQVEIKRVESHRSSMNKKNHQYLYVRQNFKMGVFCELFQDFTSALNYFREAYSNLAEIRLTETNEYEVKTVVGFVGYKLFRTQFILNQPRDAISHFKAHIEYYKRQTGHQSLLFQHYAWLSKQYSVFAELFDSVIKQGLPAVQTQHPGFYFKNAAHFAEQRKMACRQLCQAAKQYPEGRDPLQGGECLEFYGQRPWRPCKLSAEPLDPDLERNGILALQYVESHHVDHSGIIIQLLSNAITQFKTYKCPRMRKHLVVKMADEYYIGKDYSKALTLLIHMLRDYRVESWSYIGDILMARALCAAFLTAQITDYVTLCSEAIARFDNTSDTARVYNNLIAVSNGQCPEAEPGLIPEEASYASAQWRLAQADSPMIIESDLFSSPIHCKAFFTTHEYDCIEITVALRSLFPGDFVFSKLSVVLKNASNQYVERVVTEGNVSLAPHQLQHFSCKLVPDISDVDKQIQITSVLITFGQIEGRVIIFKFNGLGSCANAIYPELLFFKQANNEESEFFKVRPNLSCVVSRRHAKMSLKVAHKPPALLDEWYPLRIVLDNSELSPVSQLVGSICIVPSNNQAIVESTVSKDSDSNSVKSLPVSWPMDLTETTWEKLYFVKCSSLEARRLEVKLSYKVEGHDCLVECPVTFDVNKSFSVSATFLSPKFELLNELYNREPFIVQPCISSVSPWPITIRSTSVHLAKAFQVKGSQRQLLENCIVCEGNEVRDIICAVTDTTSEQPVQTGTYSFEWSRSGELETSKFTFTLPAMRISESPVTLRIESPSFGTLRTPYIIKYCLINHSHKFYTFKVSVEPSYAFLFAGIEKATVYLQPHHSKVLEYSMLPVNCGDVPLPRVVIEPMNKTELPHFNDMIRRALPTNIFIMPESKASEESKVFGETLTTL